MTRLRHNVFIIKMVKRWPSSKNGNANFARSLNIKSLRYVLRLGFQMSTDLFIAKFEHVYCLPLNKNYNQQNKSQTSETTSLHRDPA